MATSPIFLAEAKGMETASSEDDDGADAVVPGLALTVTKCKGLSDAFEAFRASMHVRILIHAGEGASEVFVSCAAL